MTAGTAVRRPILDLNEGHSTPDLQLLSDPNDSERLLSARGEFDDVEAEKGVAGFFATLHGPFGVLDVDVHRLDGGLADRPDLSYTLRDTLRCDVGAEERRSDGRERDDVRTAAANHIRSPDRDWTEGRVHWRTVQRC